MVISIQSSMMPPLYTSIDVLLPVLLNISNGGLMEENIDVNEATSSNLALFTLQNCHK